MRLKWLVTIASIVAASVAAASLCAQSNGTILYRFQNGADGAVPAAPLIADASGNLYGTTSGYAQGPDYGSVFRLRPPQSVGGLWEETTLHSFHGQSDGAAPLAALVPDPEGNLYGTTASGGSTEQGVIFKLTPALGEWTEQVLFNFSGGDDGASPTAPLVRDIAGNLYGVTGFGGATGNGVIFELSVDVPTGEWSETVLYTFSGAYGDCGMPENIVLDGNGSLYGVCYEGGSAGDGLVFSLTLLNNSWTRDIIYEFKGGLTGWRPLQITFGPDGNLYGTTMEGGAHNGGVIFELLRPTGGQGWTEKVIHYFPIYYGDHRLVSGVGVTFGPGGVIYGAEGDGGVGFGSVYRLAPRSDPDEPWMKIPIYAFPGGFGGYFPEGPPIVGFGGLLYGTTGSGGYLRPCSLNEGCGAVYAVKP